MVKCIYPNWPAPNNVYALTTTRLGGVSLPPYDSLNLGNHVNDNLVSVLENRKRVISSQHIPSEPIWLNQIHSSYVTSNYNPQQIIDADASYFDHAKQVSVVLTADCLPVLFCSTQGDEVASAHAGWRGLCDGILENTVSHFKCEPDQIMAWLGPAIGPQEFEVGVDVKQQFEDKDPNASMAFSLIDGSQQKYLANLYLLAKQRLTKLGVNQVYGGEYCTYTQSELFYSYRKEKRTGRMASMIWFE